MKQIDLVSPFRCRMWAMHDRMEDYVTEETCRTEIESFSKHGQMVPVLGRRVTDDPQHDVELIYGARRLFVARHLNIQLRVEIRQLTDIEAIVAIDIENRQRSDISPYERGISYLQWIRAGYFKSQDEIARTLHVSPSQVSRLFKLTQLPAVLIDAFASPHEIREMWGLRLAEAMGDSRKEATLRIARELRRLTPRLAPEEVMQRLLLTRTRSRKALSSTHDEVVKDEYGRPLFRIKHRRDSIALVVPVKRLSRNRLAEVRGVLTEVLKHEGREEQPFTSSVRVQEAAMKPAGLLAPTTLHDPNQP